MTAVMDYLFFGNRLAPLSLLGMGLIVVGLLFVFRKPAARLAEAAFAVVFIAEMQAIEPLYQQASATLVALEAGYMGQLLLAAILLVAALLLLLPREADIATAGVRAMRRHEIERIGLGWMSGVIDDKASLAGMTDVYDAAIDASLTWAIRHQTQEMGLDEAPAAIAVIGMGRYGGREVNFSSDADVIIIYRPSDNADDNQANLFARKVQEDLRAILQGPTTLEPKIELDMDLRPEGKNGPLVRSYASCEEYYRSWASTWEHQALLRARYAAGDAALAEDFLMNVADPLRYPKIDLTEAQVAEIRKLKARMEAERLPRGVRRDRHLKLGKGGLSDVEWTIQLLQLQHAGDNANLRVNGTMQALDELERRKLVSAGDAVVLRRAWWMCTAARNGSYLWSGRVNQADILPDDTYSLGGLAVYLGYDANRGQHFENDLLAVMRKARDVTERLFYGLS